MGRADDFAIGHGLPLRRAYHRRPVVSAERHRWASQDAPLWGDVAPAAHAPASPPDAGTIGDHVSPPVPLSVAVAEYVQRALDAREAQGLPRYVSDPLVTQEIDRILRPRCR